MQGSYEYFCETSGSSQRLFRIEDAAKLIVQFQNDVAHLGV